MRQGKITLILLIVCLVGGGIYFFLRENVKTSRERQEKRSRVFDGLTGDQINTVEITGADRQLELKRQAGKWNIRKPFAAKANRGEVDGLLYNIEYLEHTRRITAQEMADGKNTLADYGLEKPRLKLKLITDKGEHTVAFGHPARQGEGVYAQVDDRKSIFLMNKTLAEKLEQPLEQWRDHSVLDVDGEIVRVEVKSPKRVIEFARQNDAWRVVQPLNVRASAHAVETLVNSLLKLQAEKFLSEEGADLKKYHLDEPHYQITIKTAKTGDAGQVLLIGAPTGDNQWSAARKGQSSIVTLAAKFVESLDADLQEFRDPQLVHLDKRDIEAFEVRQADKLIRVEKAEEGWKITEPKTEVADRELVDQFLTRLTASRIQEFTTDILTEVEKYGVSDKALAVRLFGKRLDKGKEAPVLANIRVGSRNPKRPMRYVKRDEESSVYGVSEEDLKFVPTDALAMRDRVFVNVPREAIREVRLKTPQGELVARKNEKGDWIAQGTLDKARLDKIVGDASRLMAVRLVTENQESPDPKLGFQKPMGWLTLTERNGQEQIDHEFVVGSKTEGKTFLYYKNKKLVAEIPVVVAEELTTPFVSKNP